MTPVICFARGQSFYQIAKRGVVYLGLKDGRVVASSAERAEVARALISNAGPRV